MYVDLNTLHNPATGNSPPATWGDQARDNFEDHETRIAALESDVRFAAQRTTTQSIPTGAWTPIDCTTVLRDDGSDFSSPTFTVPVDDWYDFSGQVVFASNAVGVRGVGIRVNGTDFPGVLLVPAASSTGTFLAVSVNDVWLTAGNTVQLVAYHTVGAALNAAGISSQPLRFTGRAAK